MYGTCAPHSPCTLYRESCEYDVKTSSCSPVKHEVTVVQDTFNAAAVAATCTDDTTWADGEGTMCSSYTAAACLQQGSIPSLAHGSKTAMQACCICQTIGSKEQLQCVDDENFATDSFGCSSEVTVWLVPALSMLLAH